MIEIQGLGLVDLFDAGSRILPALGAALPTETADSGTSWVPDWTGKTPPARPEALEEGKKAVFKRMEGETFLVVEFTGEGVKAGLKGGDGEEAPYFQGPLISGNDEGLCFCGEAPDRGTGAKVSYSFEGDGTLVILYSEDIMKESGEPQFWYRVEGEGSMEPAPAEGFGNGE